MSRGVDKIKLQNSWFSSIYSDDFIHLSNITRSFINPTKRSCRIFFMELWGLNKIKFAKNPDGKKKIRLSRTRRSRVIVLNVMIRCEKWLNFGLWGGSPNSVKNSFSKRHERFLNFIPQSDPKSFRDTRRKIRRAETKILVGVWDQTDNYTKSYGKKTHFLLKYLSRARIEFDCDIPDSHTPIKRERGEFKQL